MKKKILLIFATSIVLTLLSAMFGLVWPTLEPHAAPTLPPRETPSPVPTNNDKNDDDDDSGPSSPVGAIIELQIQPGGGNWAGVEWLGSDGNWHKVDGWQGSLDGTWSQRWWVAAKDFGTGPFRWQLYDSPGGSPLIASDSFNLPNMPNQTVRVEIGP